MATEGAPARAVLADAKHLRQAGLNALEAASERKAAAHKVYEAARNEVVARQLGNRQGREEDEAVGLWPGSAPDG